jgi:hypothetical protein
MPAYWAYAGEPAFVRLDIHGDRTSRLVRFPAMPVAYFRVSTVARYRSSVSTSAGSATVSAIS